jgi:hypothetical protein
MNNVRNRSRDELNDMLLSLYEEFLDGIDLSEYEDKMLKDRIQFLEKINPKNCTKEEIENLSKSVLDATAISTISGGEPVDFEVKDRNNIGKKKDIENRFIKKCDGQVKNYLLELLVHSWYISRGFDLEDFDKSNNLEEGLKTPDFRLKEEKEFIEVKRISGDMKSGTDNNLYDAVKKFEDCQNSFPDYNNHVIVDLGKHSEFPIGTKYSDFFKQDLDSEELEELRQFVKDEVERREDSPIDKITICWISSFETKGTPLYTLHKTVENSFSEEKLSKYEGWTVKILSKSNDYSVDDLMVYTDNKGIEHAKADKDALGV